MRRRKLATGDRTYLIIVRVTTTTIPNFSLINKHQRISNLTFSGLDYIVTFFQNEEQSLAAQVSEFRGPWHGMVCDRKGLLTIFSIIKKLILENRKNESDTSKRKDPLLLLQRGRISVLIWGHNSHQFTHQVTHQDTTHLNFPENQKRRQTQHCPPVHRLSLLSRIISFFLSR